VVASSSSLSGLDVGSNETPFLGFGRGVARWLEEEEEDVDEEGGGGAATSLGVEEGIGNEMNGCVVDEELEEEETLKMEEETRWMSFEFMGEERRGRERTKEARDRADGRTGIFTQKEKNVSVRGESSTAVGGFQFNREPQKNSKESTRRRPGGESERTRRREGRGGNSAGVIQEKERSTEGGMASERERAEERGAGGKRMEGEEKERSKEGWNSTTPLERSIFPPSSLLVRSIFPFPFCGL